MKFQGVQLAKEYDPAKAVFPMLAEPKLDGYRLMAVVDELGNSTFHCRDSKPVDWQHNLRYIAGAIRAAGFRDCILDGEVMAETWNKTAIVKRKTLSAEDEEYLRTKVKYYLFDYLWPDLSECCDSGQFGRINQLAYLVCTIDSMYLKQLKAEWVESHADVLAYQAKCIAQGYEGCMLKDPDAPYSFKRSKAWQKVKPVRTFEALAVGIQDGKGKHSGRLGALVCRDKDGNEFNVGTGFSDDEREQTWDLPCVIEVSAQDDKVAVGVVRNPSFVRLRPDRTTL